MKHQTVPRWPCEYMIWTAVKTLLADHRPHLFCSLAHLSVAPWRKVGGLFWAPKWPVSGELSIGVAEKKVGKKGGWGTLMWCRMRYTSKC